MPFPNSGRSLFLACVAASVIFGALAALFVLNYMPKSNEQLMGEFYATETAVSVSPSDYVRHLEAGTVDGLLVDLRFEEAYAAGHLVTAVNIPASSMTSAQVVEAFRALPKDKPVITYCYSSYCMLSRHVGKALADNGIYVMHLTAGGYEIMRDFGPYVVNGTSPGTFEPKAGEVEEGSLCSGEGGEFGC